MPGGGTIVTLTCGITKQPRRWFGRWTAVAAVIWSSYATMLGFAGGRTFQDDHTKAFVVAFAIAIGATVLIEAARFLLHRLRGAHGGDGGTP